MDVINPRILTVSDIHLGSLDSERDLFIQFLKDIVNGIFGNELQALIILGDFIDLCTDLLEILLKREIIQEIFKLLLEIKKKMNIIYILGNHEIPVTGDYDKKFNRRKEKFLKKFKNSNFNELFNEELLCQYVILKRQNNNNMILLYNSRDQIENNPINKVKIEGLDLDEDYRCLMFHGYQCDSEIYRFFVGQIWKSLISNNKFEIKETFDYFWNEIIKNGRKLKPITFEKMKEELAKLKNVSLESQDALFSELSFLEFNLIKANMRIMKNWQRASKPDYYFDEIKAFLEDDNYNFSKINHIVFGHSHHSGIFYGNINNQKVEIINDGAWQHVQPSYLEILLKGKLVLKGYPNITKS
ncbi:MAG: metallophosphoesterase [Promethearchaeota archaeon]